MNAGIPRPEYPRPVFQRDNWANLNGTWDFAFDPDNQGLAQRWFDPASEVVQGSIVVPFPWQSTLSGVADPDQHGVAWYRRTFTIPEAWQGQHVVLRGHGDAIWGIAFAPDGHTVLTGSFDGVAMLWNIHHSDSITAHSATSGCPQQFPLFHRNKRPHF